MARESLSWSGLLSIGTACGAMLVVGFGLGWWLDGLLHSSPAFVLVGIGLGVAAAGAYTYVEIRKVLND